MKFDFIIEGWKFQIRGSSDGWILEFWALGSWHELPERHDHDWQARNYADWLVKESGRVDQIP